MVTGCSSLQRGIVRGHGLMIITQTMNICLNISMAMYTMGIWILISQVRKENISKITIMFIKDSLLMEFKTDRVSKNMPMGQNTWDPLKMVNKMDLENLLGKKIQMIVMARRIIQLKKKAST